MFKIRLLQNKEAIVLLSVGIGLLVLVGLNALVLIPKILELYAKNSNSVNNSLIEKEVVNQAIELLKP